MSEKHFVVGGVVLSFYGNMPLYNEGHFISLCGIVKFECKYEWCGTNFLESK